MKLYINDQLFYLKNKQNSKITILEFCLLNGIYIPSFCYNKYLKIAGNCRICLIEIIKILKPVISCLTLCIDNLKIYTTSYMLKKYRENILEFLLLNHPLDCAICDQAGECDLQEQTLFFGLDRSRFFFTKKVYINFFFTSFIKILLNRCILCLRCIRFLTEINQIFFFKEKNLGILGRGNLSKITLYNFFESNTSISSANIIDLCPVGALTLKINQFSIRPWELEIINLLNIFDLLGSFIRIEVKNLIVYRILQYETFIFKHEFILDSIRFNFLNVSKLINSLNIKDNKIKYELKNLNTLFLFNLFKGFINFDIFKKFYLLKFLIKKQFLINIKVLLNKNLSYYFFNFKSLITSNLIFISFIFIKNCFQLYLYLLENYKIKKNLYFLNFFDIFLLFFLIYYNLFFFFTRIYLILENTKNFNYTLNWLQNKFFFFTTLNFINLIITFNFLILFTLQLFLKTFKIFKNFNLIVLNKFFIKSNMYSNKKYNCFYINSILNNYKYQNFKNIYNLNGVNLVNKNLIIKKLNFNFYLFLKLQNKLIIYLI